MMNLLDDAGAHPNTLDRWPAHHRALKISFFIPKLITFYHNETRDHFKTSNFNIIFMPIFSTPNINLIQSEIWPWHRLDRLRDVYPITDSEKLSSGQMCVSPDTQSFLFASYIDDFLIAFSNLPIQVTILPTSCCVMTII